MSQVMLPPDLAEDRDAYGIGSVATYRIEGGWDGNTNNWFSPNERGVFRLDSQAPAIVATGHPSSNTLYIPIYIHKAMTVDYFACLTSRSSGTADLDIGVYGVDSGQLPTGSPEATFAIDTFASTGELEWEEIAISPSLTLAKGFYWVSFNGVNCSVGGLEYTRSVNPSPADVNVTYSLGIQPFMNIPIGTATTSLDVDSFTPALQGASATPMDPIDLTNMTGWPLSNNDGSTTCPAMAFRTA